MKEQRRRGVSACSAGCREGWLLLRWDACRSGPLVVEACERPALGMMHNGASRVHKQALIHAPTLFSPF